MNDNERLQNIEHEIIGACKEAIYLGYQIEPQLYGIQDKCLCPLTAVSLKNEYQNLTEEEKYETELVNCEDVKELLSISHLEFDGFIGAIDGDEFNPIFHDMDFYNLGLRIRDEFIEEEHHERPSF